MRASMLILVAIIAVLVISFTFIPMLTNTASAPTPPKGGNNHDYDAEQNTRKSLADLIATGTSGITEETLMTQVSVATANYGGIFTEDHSWLNPWNGRVDPEAVRLQIEAGARAVIFDIWPDPANRAIPVVCAMKDTNEYGTLGWWRSNGLDKGVGQYSNWQLVTRNKVPATDMINMAITTAFAAQAPNAQTGDPFFLILRLHGAMTIDYLNYLGDAVRTALGEHRMETQWDRIKNQSKLCGAKVSEFLHKCCVIVSPDIQPTINALPNTNTWDSFQTQFLTTSLGEVTNILESSPGTIFYSTGNLDAINKTTLSGCVPGMPPMTPAQAGFCVIQPTVGGTTNSNDKQLGKDTFNKARQVGAQFVAINYFPPSKSDSVLAAVLDPTLFGVYSFKKGA